MLKVAPPETESSPLLQPVFAPQLQTQPQGQTVTATVVAQTSSGQPLLETADGGALLVNQRVSSPIGTEITLQRLTPDQAQNIVQSSPVAQPQNPSGAPARSSPSLPPLSDVPLTIARQQPWPALTQLLTTLGGSSPVASAFIRQAIPTLGPGFAQAFTAFLTRGDGTATYPPAPGTLTVPLTGSGQARGVDPQELKTALLQIASDFSSAAAKTGAALQPQAWQSYQVPVLTDYGISMAQLFMRQQSDIVDDDAGRQGAAASTRFLLEISPSQLGPVQLDGLLRKTTTRVDRLDLIVRTEFAVPPDAAGQMSAMFQSTMGATGMVGNLGFQVGPENFVLPSSDSDQHYRSGV